MSERRSCNFLGQGLRVGCGREQMRDDEDKSIGGEE